MCLIVVKDNARGKFTIENFETSYSRNSDGLGIMWAEGGRVHVERVVGTLKAQRKLFERHMHRSFYIMHQRFATHGAKDLKNCHPYKVLSVDDGDAIDLYMVHNGTISGAKTTDKGMSDTWNFVENHIKPILKANHKLLDHDGVQMMINNYINGSKLVFLDGDGNTLTFNKNNGSIVNGCWLSNTHSIYSNNTNTRAYHETYYKGERGKWPEDEESDEGYAYAGYGGRSYYGHNHDGGFWHEGKRYNTWFDYHKAKNDTAPKLLGPLIDAEGNPITSTAIVKPVETITPAMEDSIKAILTATGGDKEAIITALKDQIIKIEDLEGTFTKEELADFEEEMTLDDDIKQLAVMIRESYDPDHVDQQQMQVLINKVSKDFGYPDLELMVEHEPQVAADMLEYLLKHFVDSELLLKAA